jgi:ribosomal protein S21
MSTNLVVPVFGNDVTTAFLKLKRATHRTGLLREMRVHEFYLPPSARRRLKSERARKAARQRLAKRVVRTDGNGDPI